MLARSHHRGKSAARKPLSDASNGGNKPQRSLKKETVPFVESKDSLDRLLQVRSDLANLINQFDEMVALAIQQKTISKKANQEIESFSRVLSDINSFLKPWRPRLQQAFTTNSLPFKDQLENRSFPTHPTRNGEEETLLTVKKEKFEQLDSIVSPSPLVSWRAGPCKVIDAGKQLFLLTPLPKYRLHSSNRNINDNTTNNNNRLPSLLPITDDNKCAVKSEKDLKIGESSNEEQLSEVSKGLALKYPELFGKFTESPEIINRKKEVNVRMFDWSLSPPKTCVPLEPSLTPIINDDSKNELMMSVTNNKKGETTLKRELWTKFEAVSKEGLRLSKDVLERTTNKKGFLDMLDEAC